MKIRFDHIYTVDYKFTFFKKLKKVGFILEDKMVEHPGKHFCRFIRINKFNKTGKQYLEFVHIGKNGASWNKPGLSLAADKSLKQLHLKLKNKKVKSEFTHKNYDWKINSVDRLPGWNLLTFPKHQSQIYFWLTEYEPSKNRKKYIVPKHKNGVNSVWGIIADLSSADIKLFTRLIGKSKNNIFQLSCGFKINFKLAKVSRINTLVLNTKALSKANRTFKFDDLTIFDGRPALHIKNPTKGMWDLLVV